MTNENRKITGPTVRKPIDDLGIAAYLKMFGWRVIGRKGKTIVFEVAESDEQEFDKTAFEYLSTPYYAFASKLMLLKKMGQYCPD